MSSTIMPEPKDVDAVMEEDYDEEQDSDFDGGEAADNFVSSSEEESQSENKAVDRTQERKRRTEITAETEHLVELDSGDEETIRDRQKMKRKKRRRGSGPQKDGSDAEDHRWRARTRAMQQRDKEEKKRKNLGSIKGATVDIDKLWEEMNRPGAQGLSRPPSAAEPDATKGTGDGDTNDNTGSATTVSKPDVATSLVSGQASKQNGIDDTITIRRTYKFAGEVITEEKIVPRSSAEGQLWVSQQPTKDAPLVSFGTHAFRRPLRKISRFDPNFNNLERYMKIWGSATPTSEGAKGPTLNTVEKSKMDWAVHVDKQGLQEELDEHSKAKEGYLSRMDFLGQVEQRREEEARAARLRG